MPLRRHLVIPAVSASCYAALAELYFRGDRAVRMGRFCEEAPADYSAQALAIGAAVFVVATGWSARSRGVRWKAATALQSSLALLAGGFVGHAWYTSRMEHGSECVRIMFCTWCMDHWWDDPWVGIVLLALVGALLSLPVGHLARRLRPRGTGASLPDPESRG